MVVASLAMTLPALPAAAQGAPGEGMVEGIFRVTIEGELPENYSVYVETDAMTGGQGPICTTDAAMVAEGYTECVGGANELLFYAPEGTTVKYRILGSQGTGLSQKVIEEGSAIAKTDGLTVEANLAFAAEEETPAPDETGAEPDDVESDDVESDDAEPGAADDQYSDDTPAPEGSSGSDAASSASADSEADPASDGQTSKVAEANGGVLPDTGGAPLSLLAGAALLLSAGGFLAYRIAS